MVKSTFAVLSNGTNVYLLLAVNSLMKSNDKINVQNVLLGVELFQTFTEFLFLYISENSALFKFNIDLFSREQLTLVQGSYVFTYLLYKETRVCYGVYPLGLHVIRNELVHMVPSTRCSLTSTMYKRKRKPRVNISFYIIL